MKRPQNDTKRTVGVADVLNLPLVGAVSPMFPYRFRDREINGLATNSWHGYFTQRKSTVGDPILG